MSAILITFLRLRECASSLGWSDSAEQGLWVPKAQSPRGSCSASFGKGTASLVSAQQASLLFQLIGRPHFLLCARQNRFMIKKLFFACWECFWVPRFALCRPAQHQRACSSGTCRASWQDTHPQHSLTSYKLKRHQRRLRVKQLSAQTPCHATNALRAGKAHQRASRETRSAHALQGPRGLSYTLLGFQRCIGVKWLPDHLPHKDYHLQEQPHNQTRQRQPDQQLHLRQRAQVHAPAALSQPKLRPLGSASGGSEARLLCTKTIVSSSQGRILCMVPTVPYSNEQFRYKQKLMVPHQMRPDACPTRCSRTGARQASYIFS